MNRPTIDKIFGSKRPVKPWHVESYTDAYGGFIVDEINEACMQCLIARMPNCISWINGLDWFTSNAIAQIPLMVTLLVDLSNDPDVHPDLKKRILKLLIILDSCPEIPETTKKKRRRKHGKNIDNPKPVLLGKQDKNPKV